MAQKEWRVFTGKGRNVERSKRYNEVRKLAPPWRDYSKGPQELDKYRADSFVLNIENEYDKKVIDLINAALYLQKPLLVKGSAGVGKSSLAYAIAGQLNLGEVIVWPITSRSTVKDGLYKYEILRHFASITTQPRGNNKVEKVEKVELRDFFTLKQLGAALVDTDGEKPRVLLIDEIDKADMDLPNDLLHVLEYGRFKIDEWVQENDFKVRSFQNNRLLNGVVDKSGWVNAKNYPIIVMTSNGEREFPAPFLRRCITIELDLPDEEKLKQIVHKHYKEWVKNVENGDGRLKKAIDELIPLIVDETGRQKITGGVSIDKLLGAVHMFLHNMDDHSSDDLLRALMGID